MKLFAVLRLLGEPQFCLQRNSIGKPAFLAFGDRVLGLLHIVFDELEEKILPGIGDREIHFEHCLQAFVFPPCGRQVGLQETSPRLQLDIQQVRSFHNLRDLAE